MTQMTTDSLIKRKMIVHHNIKIDVEVHEVLPHNGSAISYWLLRQVVVVSFSSVVSH